MRLRRKFAAPLQWLYVLSIAVALYGLSYYSYGTWLHRWLPLLIFLAFMARRAWRAALEAWSNGQDMRPRRKLSAPRRWLLVALLVPVIEVRLTHLLGTPSTTLQRTRFFIWILFALFSIVWILYTLMKHMEQSDE